VVPYSEIIPGRSRIGIAGAGTMGSGIALTALIYDFPVTLYDISPEMLSKARQYIEYHLNRKQKAISIKYLELTSNLEKLGNCAIVIEAIVEDLNQKRALFKQLDAICLPPTILATNTSTLSVTEIAAEVPHPERVTGMHFFNPPSVMTLVEVVRAAQTSDATIETVSNFASFMGKTPVSVRDSPGFIVNRVARPFYGEALRLYGEKATTPEQIDRILRDGGGFRMGPFQLMDLIGIDVNLAATKSIYEQTFFEPRYRPHHIQVQMVNQKLLGRKSGRGFYQYDPPLPIEDRKKPSGISSGKIEPGLVYVSDGIWARGFVDRFRLAGFEVLVGVSEVNQLELMAIRIAVVSTGKHENLREKIQQLDKVLPPGCLILSQCCDCTLAEIVSWLQHPERVVGFDGLFWSNRSLISYVKHKKQSPSTRIKAENFADQLGYPYIWIEDTPGLVLPRVICMLINEAAFTVGDDVADTGTIDLAVRLGLNYPKGLFEWGSEIGYAQVVAVLDHLYQEFQEERYRVAPLLRRWARSPNQ
jgi:3-hydroxybutyryl-CoA dehydrogenase